MADEQNMDGAEEAALSTVNQSSLLSPEALNVKQEVSLPIPGFPPLFQFAKLQTEASSWSSNAAATSDKTARSEVNAGVSNEPSDISDSNDESRPVNGLDVVVNMEDKPENEPEQAEDGEGEDIKATELDKDEDGVINDEPDEEEAESDPYFYTKRDEFTSEIYKIELQNLPKKCGYKVSYNLNLAQLTCYISKSEIRTVPTKYKGFYARLTPRGKSRSLQGLLESSKRFWVSHAFFPR